MTEQEWLACEDTNVMLDWLRQRDHQQSDRKLRLFAVACVRQVWSLLSDMRSRTAVEVAEKFADGEASRTELDAARGAAFATARDAARGAAFAAAWATAWDAARGAARAAPRIVQADLLCDIVGNPFRPLTIRSPCDACSGTGSIVTIDGIEWGCLECGGNGHMPGTGRNDCDFLTPTVVSLAQAAYDERGDNGALDPVRLAVLADALEEAGCDGQRIWLCNNQGKHQHRGKRGEVIHGVTHSDNPWHLHHHHDAKCSYMDIPNPLLAHLCSPGQHVRGCHVVDLILGRP